MASPFFMFIAYTFAILDGYSHQTIDYISNTFNGFKMAYFSKQSVIILYFYLKYNKKILNKNGRKRKSK